MASYNKVEYNYLPKTNWESYSGTDNPFMAFTAIYYDFYKYFGMFSVVFLGSWLISPYLVNYLPGSALLSGSFLAGTYAVFSNTVLAALNIK